MKATHSSWRKLTAMLAACILLLGLAGCGASNGTAATQAPTAEASKPEADTGAKVHTIGYSLNSMDSTMKTMADYFESVAREHGWEPVLLNANGDVATELNNMESLMNMGCEAVVIMGCDTAGSAAAIEELGAAGVPVIIAGRKIEAKEESYYTYVAGDHHEAGKAQAGYLNGLLEKDAGLELNVDFLYGQSGSSSVQQRYEGFESDCLNGKYADRVHLIASQYAEFDTQKAYDITTDMLTSYDNINCFVTQSDEQASGIINAIKAKGGSLDDYIVVSIDCSTTGQSYLKSGELDATVLMAMRQLAVSSADYVEAALNGETVEKTNQVVGYYQLVTPDTYVDVMKAAGMEPAA